MGYRRGDWEWSLNRNIGNMGQWGEGAPHSDWRCLGMSEEWRAGLDVQGEPMWGARANPVGAITLDASHAFRDCAHSSCAEQPVRSGPSLTLGCAPHISPARAFVIEASVPSVEQSDLAFSHPRLVQPRIAAHHAATPELLNCLPCALGYDRLLRASSLYATPSPRARVTGMTHAAALHHHGHALACALRPRRFPRTE